MTVLGDLGAVIFFVEPLRLCRGWRVFVVAAMIDPIGVTGELISSLNEVGELSRVLRQQASLGERQHRSYQESKKLSKEKKFS